MKGNDQSGTIINLAVFFHRHTISSSVSYINVMRDPLERTISEYYYALYGSPGDRILPGSNMVTMRVTW